MIVGSHATEAIQIRHATAKLVLQSLIVDTRRSAHLVVELLNRVLVCQRSVGFQSASMVIEVRGWPHDLPLLTWRARTMMPTIARRKDRYLAMRK